MRRLLICFFTLFVVFAASVPPAAAQARRMETIAAVVNEDVVSESDVMARIKLVIASSGMPDNPDIREKIRPQILNVLIEEKLKLQEAERLEIEILPEDIADGFNGLARQNNMTPEQFKATLHREGALASTLEDQIRAQIAWSRVIQVRLRPQVTISDNEVDAVLKRLEANQGKTEYLVSEIFLPVEKPADEPDVRKLADRLTAQLREGRVPFKRLAGQFSQSAGANKGGDLGWVQEGQLAESLDNALARLQEGALSPPIRSLSGFHILYLRKKRTITDATIPSADKIMYKLGMERLDRLQRSYLMDLKTQAFIEERGA